jgi:hypothetical protein
MDASGSHKQKYFYEFKREGRHDMSSFNPTEWISAYRATQATGVTARTLRTWESKGLIQSKRSPTNHRIYNIASLPGKSKCSGKIPSDSDSKYKIQNPKYGN